MNTGKSKISLGICIGASTISMTMLEKHNEKISLVFTKNIVHNGNPKNILENELSCLELENTSVTVTGRKFKYLLNSNIIPEPKAVENSVKFLKLTNYAAVASLGGENFMVYCLDESGNIDKVLTGNKCASGTGEFFLQQIRRMNLNVEEAVSFSQEKDYYKVSGRCSVFCKSDCTHALNKGIEKSKVVSGLSKMIADKTIELLSKQKSDKIIIIGGVSQNKTVVSFIKDKYPDIFIPEQAVYFESLGAALESLNCDYKLDRNNLFKQNHKNFTVLEPLFNGKAKVVFKEFSKSTAKENDICILGLDVGSTTTKAVIVRVADNSILASVYLRTNGNPVNASVECYKRLKEQIPVKINIIGLGTTGSGRHIAALHALTDGVINEIIAHSVASAYFDKEVDTIFEIGGQDAKYTYLTNGIASDYAMNEACSAGTGSFLEESAKETLNIEYYNIADIAFKSKNPINFNDQCAAFISSDIKNASHDGASLEDIVAGLVYSICMNYINRVKGNRTVGKKVFMQGGVCYNKAIPYAMSNLINKEIIVPPEPGLMGAFGVALEIKNRLNIRLLNQKEFNLDSLINRKIIHKNDFICKGGKEKCDLKCKIASIEIDGKVYPFGGACSKYYNINKFETQNSDDINYVKLRQKLVFEKYLIKQQGNGEKVGILKSFLTNSLYPLYYNFFAGLNFKVCLSDGVEQKGIDKIRSAFCYPVELSHGMFMNLLEKKPDFIFIPHITQMSYDDKHTYKRICVFVQGESYYLKSAFGKESLPPIINPVINFNCDRKFIEKKFIEIGKQFGRSSSDSKKSFNDAYDIYLQMIKEIKEIGRKFIEYIENEKDEFAVVLFGRSYNAFSAEANLNIPHKFATKGIKIIPHDFIPSDNYESFDNMYWYSGQQIMKAARFVKKHNRLFGVYITNFSCGPDSFIISYFRNIMGNKPSLTLELDSHSADVGIETRIDASLDIIKNYRELSKSGIITKFEKKYEGLRILNENNHITIYDNNNKKYYINSPEIEVLIPSMGRFSSDAFSSVFKSLGINSRPVNLPTFHTLKCGKGLTTCKECLPFILTAGSMVEYLQNNGNKNVLYFMPHGYGPCRQGQYYIMLKEIIKNSGYKNVGILTMDEETSFEDFGSDFFRKGWIALVISDLIHDIESTLLVLAVNREDSVKILDSEWRKIKCYIENWNEEQIYEQLEKTADTLSKIPLKYKLKDAKIISLIGEIYVRREEYSKGELINTLRKNNFVVKIAPITEYLYYSNYLIINNKVSNTGLKEKTKIIIKDYFQRRIEKKIKKILSKSALCTDELVNIDKTMCFGKKYIPDDLIGEGILTTGLALREILDESCGVVSIGPFNCMPSRLSDSILNQEMTLEGKLYAAGIKKNGYPEDIKSLPFLYLETDGNEYPQISQSNLEIFMMQAEKLHSKLKNNGHR